MEFQNKPLKVAFNNQKNSLPCHKISKTIIRKWQHRIAKLFFQKEDIFCRRSIHSIQGYSSKGREILEDKNLYEFKESLDVQSVAPSCILPDDALPELRNSLKYLSSQIKELCKFFLLHN